MNPLSNLKLFIVKVMIILCFIPIIAMVILIVIIPSGCAYNGTSSVNLSIINSRSPATNAEGMNEIQAATGFSGGGTLDTTVPVSVMP